MTARHAPSWRAGLQGRLPALAGIVVCGTVLRLLALDKPLYIDEIVSLTVASQPLDQMARAMRLIDASPALSPLLLHFWLAICDCDIWARLLMAIFGSLTIVVAYAVGARAVDERTGLWTAFVVAISPSLVHYSQYVRNYSLFTLLAAIHLWLTLRWFADEGREHRGYGEIAACAAVATAMIYTHYLAVLYFAATGLVVVGRIRRSRREVLTWMAAHVVALLLFIPGIPLLRHNIDADAVRNAQRVQPAAAYILGPNLALELVEGQRALGFSAPAVRRGVLAAAGVVFPLLLTVGCVSAWRGRRYEIVLLLAVAVLPPAFYVITGRRLVAVRFFLPSLLAALVLVAHGARVLPQRLRPVAATVLVVLAGVPLWHFLTSYQWSYDHAAVARAIRERSRPGDMVLVVHPYEAFYYRRYLREALPVRGITFTPLEDQSNYVIKPQPLDALAVRPRVEELMRRGRRAWVIGQSTRSFASSPTEERALLAWMATRYGRIGTLDPLTGGDPTIGLYRAGLQ